jgi:hypothetical protein
MQTLYRKRVLLLLGFLVFPAIIGADETSQGRLDHVKTIYVIPARDRFEQFLTNEIVGWGRFEVTLNPQEADALLSDTTDINLKDLLADPPKIRRTVARTRGTAFLIDTKSEKVLWSTAKKSSDPFFLGGNKSNQELAHEIVEQLKKDMNRK